MNSDRINFPSPPNYPLVLERPFNLEFYNQQQYQQQQRSMQSTPLPPLPSRQLGAIPLSGERGVELERDILRLEVAKESLLNDRDDFIDLRESTGARAGSLNDLFSAVNAANVEDNISVVDRVGGEGIQDQRLEIEQLAVWNPQESSQLFNLLKNSIHRTEWSWESVAFDLNIGRSALSCQSRWNRAGFLVRNHIRSQLEANYRMDLMRKNGLVDLRGTTPTSSQHYQYHPKSTHSSSRPLPQPQRHLTYIPYPTPLNLSKPTQGKQKYTKQQPTSMISSTEEFGSLEGRRPKRASAVKALKGFQIENSSDSEEEEMMRAAASRRKGMKGGKGKGKAPTVSDESLSEEVGQSDLMLNFSEAGMK